MRIGTVCIWSRVKIHHPLRNCVVACRREFPHDAIVGRIILPFAILSSFLMLDWHIMWRSAFFDRSANFVRYVTSSKGPLCFFLFNKISRYRILDFSRRLISTEREKKENTGAWTPPHSVNPCTVLHGALIVAGRNEKVERKREKTIRSRWPTKPESAKTYFSDTGRQTGGSISLDCRPSVKPRRRRRLCGKKKEKNKRFQWQTTYFFRVRAIFLRCGYQSARGPRVIGLKYWYFCVFLSPL